MPCRCGYPDGMSPRGRMVFPRASPRENHPPEGRHSIRIPTLAWHICFIIPNKPQFGKISMKTTMTAGRCSENGGRFAGGHFTDGHDGMANICKPITAYDFHVRYNKTNYCTKWLFQQHRTVFFAMSWKLLSMYVWSVQMPYIYGRKQKLG